MPMMRQYKSIEHRTDDLYGQCHEFDFFSDGVQGGLYLSYWDENEGMLVRAPGLEPKSSSDYFSSMSENGISYFAVPYRNECKASATPTPNAPLTTINSMVSAFPVTNQEMIIIAIPVKNPFEAYSMRLEPIPTPPQLHLGLLQIKTHLSSKNHNF